MSARDPMEVSDENFTLKLGDQADVLVLSSFLSSRTQYLGAAKSLMDENADFYQAMQKVARLYPNGNDISNIGSNVLFLTDRLMGSELDFILLDLPLESVRELENLAFGLYLEDMVYQLRYKKMRDETMTRLIQVIVGAPIFVKIYNPDLFTKVKLISGPVQNRQITAMPEKSKVRKVSNVAQIDVQKKREELREEFRKNARTRRKFERFVSMVQNGEFDKDSMEEVREKVLARFWRPAHSKIKEWIDFEMSARRQGSGVVTEAKYSIATTLLNAKGHGIAFVSRERFAGLKAEIKKLCSNETK